MSNSIKVGTKKLREGKYAPTPAKTIDNNNVNGFLTNHNEIHMLLKVTNAPDFFCVLVDVHTISLCI